MSVERKDVWASGNAYEPYVGRWSRLVASEFLDWLGAPAIGEWLDIGCGTGALCEVILKTRSPRRLMGVDPSEGFISFARRQVTDPRVSFQVGDAQALPVADGSFDAAVSGLVLNFIPDQAKAVCEMKRVTRPGGVVAGYVWDYAGEMQMMRRFWDAAVELDPAAIPLDEGRRFPLCRPEPLAALFQSGPLDSVQVRAIDIPTVFKNFDDYWCPFLGGQAPAPGYCTWLPEDRRIALRERIREHLSIRSDGAIHLMARAWGVRGTVG